MFKKGVGAVVAFVALEMAGEAVGSMPTFVGIADGVSVGGSVGPSGGGLGSVPAMNSQENPENPCKQSHPASTSSRH